MGYQEYLEMLNQPFIKRCRLRFLQPDGSTAFALDNNPNNPKSTAFIADGNITVNLQNGKRRMATVTFGNAGREFDYSVNKIWFGQEIAIDEGLALPDGTDFYIQQGVFLVETPEETLFPNETTITYNLIDKWANLDGTLYGFLEGTYVVDRDTYIFDPITSLLQEDRGNGLPVDRMQPVYTSYYDGKTQVLPSGGSAPLTNAPYTLRIDSDGGSIADVVLGLSGMVNAWVGYDSTGRLRIDPSQDDLMDKDKEMAWRFDMNDVLFLGATYQAKNTEVYNDYIVVGEQMDDYSQPKGRAQNLTPASPTNINLIGRKIKRIQKPGFATDTQCQDLAEWELKRSSVLQQAVSISCGQIFHINENELVEIVRRDKENAPVERHLVLGFSRPLSGRGAMTIDAVSVNDLKFE